MKKISYRLMSIIFVCCLSILIAGCEQPQPPAEPSKEEQQENTARIINSYIEEAKKEAAAKPIEIDIASEIDKIESSPEAEHNLRFSVLARQLLETMQVSDAIKVVDEIDNPTIRDTCFSEIARHQIIEFSKLVAAAKSVTEREQVDKTMSVELRKIVDVIDEVSDPLLLAGLSIELAAVMSGTFDERNVGDMLSKIADKVQSDRTEIIRRVKSLQMIAGWFLKQEQKERALEICKKTEEMAEYIFNPSDGVFAMLDIVRFYTLLESVADANRVCDASIPFVAKITVPTEKATAILKIAETLSMLSMRFRDKTDVSRLVQLKKLILSVDPIIAKHDSDKTKINSSNLDSDSVSSLGSDLADHFEVEILSWAQIRSTRDTLLCNLVRHQVWFVVESRISLDEVWSTIHDINDDELRDNAIIAAVNMLCLMGSLDEANDWADFISNAEKKKDTIKKIKTKSKESKKQIEINSDTNYTEAGKAIGFALEQPLHVVALPCSALRILKRLQHSTNYLFVNNS